MKPQLAALILFVAVAYSVAAFSDIRGGVRAVPLTVGTGEGVQALHAGLGVDANRIPAASGGTGAEAVGPVSETFHSQVAELQSGLETDSTDAASLHRLATLLHDAHREAEAALYYERLLTIDPLDRQVRLDLADCYSRLSRWEEVENLMTDLLAISDADPAALYNMGAAKANRGDLEEARAWWERAENQKEDPAIARLAESALDRIG